MQLAVISMIVFSIAVYFTLRRVLQPLRKASDAAARIAPRNFSARIAIRRIPLEFSAVIDAFNQALDRLENGYRVQQAFLEATAHELKTPLALLRAQIEMEGCEDRGALLRDIDRIARQVHQLLHLAEVSGARFIWTFAAHLNKVPRCRQMRRRIRLEVHGLMSAGRLQSQ